MSSAETQLLADLAPLAGSSARAVKRYVNLYRLARAQNANHLGALAFVLALDAGGTQSEIAALNDALSNADGEADLAFHQCLVYRITRARPLFERHGTVNASRI
jgi:hypothetical protein